LRPDLSDDTVRSSSIAEEVVAVTERLRVVDPEDREPGSRRNEDDPLVDEEPVNGGDEAAEESSGDRPLRVFISYKTQDVKIANALKTELEGLGRPGLECFVSSTDTAVGAEWLETIRGQLAQADLLLLVLTFSDDQWDWPLFEAGMAFDLMKPERCRIVCLMPQGHKPPGPIKNLQAVTATKEDLKKLFLDLLTTCTLAPALPEILRPDLKTDDPHLLRAVDDVWQHFHVFRPWSRCFTYYLRVAIKKDHFEAREPPIDEKQTGVELVGLARQEIPPDSKILSNSTALELFQMVETPPGRSYWTWSDITAKANRPQDADWIRMLGERCFYASRGDILKSSTDMFEAYSDGASYRPLLHEANLLADGTMHFEVIFVEQAPS
jgi:hypothetical protein